VLDVVAGTEGAGRGAAGIGRSGRDGRPARSIDGWRSTGGAWPTPARSPTRSGRVRAAVADGRILIDPERSAGHPGLGAQTRQPCDGIPADAPGRPQRPAAGTSRRRVFGR